MITREITEVEVTEYDSEGNMIKTTRTTTTKENEDSIGQVWPVYPVQPWPNYPGPFIYCGVDLAKPEPPNEIVKENGKAIK